MVLQKGVSVENSEENFRSLYGDDYFQDRNFTDPRRMKSFLLEKSFIQQFVETGTICDVGCGTGEFLESINWQGPRYGMEISDNAKETAKGFQIDFEKNILTEKNFFDVVVLRGVIQHLPSPFEYLMASYDSLKPGGYIVFLMTPNADSLVYRLWGTLPCLDSLRNFWIPSTRTLSSNLSNIGFKVISSETPYKESPYRSFLRDHFAFFRKLLKLKNSCDFPFWGNMFQLVAQKPLS